MFTIRAIVALVALSLAGSNPALAQTKERAPEPWFVTVSHRVDLSRFGDAQNQQLLGGRYVINITAGLLVDDEGHVVTRLVNLDPTLKMPTVSVTTVTGKILRALLVGVDGPSGLAVLAVPELRGVKPAPAETAPTLAEGDAVRILYPDYRIRQIKPPIENIAITPKLKALDGRVAIATPHPALALAGVRFVIDAEGFRESQDLSIVEDAQGRLAGLVKYVADDKAQVIGLPFLRDSVARRVVDAGSSVAAGWLGANGTSTRGGVVVEEIDGNGPAAKAGLERTDVIVGYGDVRIENVVDLKNAIGATPAGTKVDLAVRRGGEPITVSPVLGRQPFVPGQPVFTQEDDRRRVALLQIHISELKKQIERAKSPEERAVFQAQLDRVTGQPPVQQTSSPAGDVNLESIGLTVLNLSGQMVQTRDVASGVLVSGVAPDSIAQRAGLLAWDIITKVDGALITDQASLRNVLRTAAKNGAAAVQLSVRRDGTTLQLPLSVESLR